MAFAQNQLGEVRTGDLMNTLNTNSNASGRNTPMVAQTIAFTTRGRADGVGIGGEVAGTLDASYYKGCGSANYGEREVVAQTIAHVVAPPPTATNDPSRKGTGGFAGMTEHHNLTATFWNGNDIAETLTRTSDDQRMPDKGRMQMVVQPVVPYDLFQVTAPINRQNRDTTSPCHTLARDNAAHAAVVQCVTGDRTHALKAEGADASEDGTGRGNPIVPVATDLYNFAINGEVTHPIRVGNGNAMGGVPSAITTMAVRRLTPRECERLQGFPDDYTRISWKKKPADECPDGPRYKALGNSMAVPVMRWIGERIAKVEKV